LHLLTNFLHRNACARNAHSPLGTFDVEKAENKTFAPGTWRQEIAKEGCFLNLKISPADQISLHRTLESSLWNTVFLQRGQSHGKISKHKHSLYTYPSAEICNVISSNVKL
jgi:hypothetical protein